MLPSHAAPAPATSHALDVDLSGRAIMVTGATGGLGRPLALACAARGATVVLHGRVVRKLEALYDEIVAAGHPQPTILPLDFASATADDFGNVAGAIRAQLGRLDGLVHTAAFLGSLGPIEHQSFDAWQKVLRVNLAAAMALTRSTLPLLVGGARRLRRVHARHARRRSARLLGRLRGGEGRAAALATTLADEWEARANLRVNAVVPGPIRSPLRMLTHPGEERSALPPPEALVPLYLYLLGAQPKAESGVRIDAHAWLAGHAASTPLVSTAAGGAAVAKHDAKPPEIVARQRVGQDQHGARRTPPRIAVRAPDDRRHGAPTYESSRIGPAHDRPSRSVTVMRRSMPTCSSAGTPRPVQRHQPARRSRR